MHSCKPAVKGAETGSLLASSLLRNRKPQGLRERLGLKGTSEWSVTETVFLASVLMCRNAHLCTHVGVCTHMWECAHTGRSVHTCLGVCTHTCGSMYKHSHDIHTKIEL